jgi:hypothetical protein
MKRSASQTKVLQAQRDNYRDCHGVDFDDVRYILGEDRSKWPKVVRVIDPDVCRIMHELHSECWKSGVPNPQAHHEFAGSAGKSDEFCAIFMLSNYWHSWVHSERFPLGEQLYLKWLHDRCHVDWVRMTLLRGSFLPELIPNEV